MGNIEEIVGWTYQGDKDSMGLPHGNGTITYNNKFRDLFKYEGEFVHGVRQGKGTFYWYAPHPEYPNPVDSYSWYSIGDYENGRLIRPKHERGSYEPFCRSWDIVYDGLWENDLPLRKAATCKKNGKHKNDEIFILTKKYNEKIRLAKEENKRLEDEKKEMVDKMCSLYNEMKTNSEEMRMWKNVALVHEFMDLLYIIYDVTELDKAETGNMVMPYISELDVPRYALQLAKEQLEWLKSSRESSEQLSVESLQAYINRLEDYIDYENISNEEFMQKYDEDLNFDTIERTPLWEENICRWGEECDKRLGDVPREMGFCFDYWHTFAEVLREEGIEWKSPAQMNPHVIFD